MAEVRRDCGAATLVPGLPSVLLPLTPCKARGASLRQLVVRWLPLPWPLRLGLWCLLLLLQLELLQLQQPHLPGALQQLPGERHTACSGLGLPLNPGGLPLRRPWTQTVRIIYLTTCCRGSLRVARLRRHPLSGSSTSKQQSQAMCARPCVPDHVYQTMCARPCVPGRVCQQLMILEPEASLTWHNL